MTAKDVKFGADARERMLRGVDILARGAASVVALLITTEAMVGEKRDSPERSLPAGGGMGDGGF